VYGFPGSASAAQISAMQPSFRLQVSYESAAGMAKFQ
jgi:hypothetical protein